MSIPYGTLRDIANELKNIREILEKQSTTEQSSIVGEWQVMKCLEATDSNGTELYLFQLENNTFISVPKEKLEFKPLQPEELKEMEGVE